MTSGHTLDVDIAGEVLTLLPERAAYWARTRTLLIADPHFGKAATFRASAIPVPRGTTTENLQRLDTMIARVGATRIIFLGDYLHARAGRSPETLRVLADWRLANSRLVLVLIRGNHDRRAGDPPSEVGMPCVDGPVLEPPFALAHHPVGVAGSYVLAGHVHPCAVLVGPARQRERLPCFLLGAEVAVLPAFGEFTGCAEVEPREGDKVWVVAGDRVLRVSPASRGQHR